MPENDDENNSSKIAPAHFHGRNKFCSTLFLLTVLTFIPFLLFISYSFDTRTNVSFLGVKHYTKALGVRFRTSKNERSFSAGGKTILIYTPLFGRQEWFATPTSEQGSIMDLCNCRVKTCHITYDKGLLNTCEAVVFHGRDMPDIGLLKQLRTQRGSLRQRWVYYVLESPINVPNPLPFNHLFNLTITFKLESDIWLPYGKFVPLETENQRFDVQRNYAAGKKPGAAWIVSHCGIRERNEYVRRLQNEYPVYVGGGCRHKFKEQITNGKNYDNEIRKRFKFYLAFENSFCQDYITEKYWERAIDNEVVPIVMGAGPYDHGRYGAIPGSFINVEWFKSVKELADYLHYLDKNDTAYNEYFKWKRHYKKYKKPYDVWPYPCTFLCELCRIIHDVNYPVKSYNMSDFYSTKKNCAGREKAVQTILGL